MRMERVVEKKEQSKLITEYSNIVNPFGNNEFKLKEPIQYLDDVKISLELNEGRNHYTSLNMYTNSYKARFEDKERGWLYDTFVPIQRNRNNGYINMGHYYLNGSDGCPVDEVVRLDYRANRVSYDHHYTTVSIGNGGVTIL